MSERIRLEDAGSHICRIVLDRAPVNALSADYLLEIAGMLDLIADDSGVNAVILTSPLKVFSAGVDLKEAQKFDLQDEQAIVNGLNVAFAKLYAFPKPVIAAIEGPALAGGLFFVLTSDYRISDQRGSFGLAEIRVGATFPIGPLEIARDSLNAPDLRRLMLSGQPYDAETALACGIIDEITGIDDVQSRALSVASQYANLPAKTYASIKSQIRNPALTRISEGLQNSDPEQGWFSSETKLAMAAMLGI